MAACIEHDGCTAEDFPKGTEIYTPQRFRRSLGIVLAGKLRVTKGELVVSVLRVGDWFGAAALFHRRETYETTLTAAEDCRILFMEQRTVSWAMGQFPTFAGGYVLYLSERIHFLNGKLEGLLAATTEEKLRRYLVERQRVECSATELAKRLDVSRASLYRAFDKLEEQGAIVRRGKEILVNQEKISGGFIV